MGSIWTLLLNGIISYAENNPTVIESLVEQAVLAIIAQLKANNTTTPVA